MSAIDVEELAERLWNDGLQPARAGEAAAGIAADEAARQATAGAGLDTALWRSWRLGDGVFVHVYLPAGRPAVIVAEPVADRPWMPDPCRCCGVRQIGDRDGLRCDQCTPTRHRCEAGEWR